MVRSYGIEYPTHLLGKVWNKQGARMPATVMASAW